MKTLSERIAFLLTQRPMLERWVGCYDEESLKKWLDGELGDHRRLEQWVDGSRVIPRGPVLHVVSGNTEHAAFQSVFRALLLGCESWVKVPSSGLLEFEQWASELRLFEVESELPEAWRSPEVAVIYGGEETITFFRDWLSPQTRIIEHGPKLSAAFVFEQHEGLEKQLAEDVMRYGQRGCLSVQAIYVAGDVEDFCEKLAEAFEERRPKIAATISEAGGIRNARELARFQIANGANMKLWESANSVDWTILLDRDSTLLRTGPNGGFVRVIPMPDVFTPEMLGDEIAFLSTAVVEPLADADRLEAIAPPRICSAGNSQEPGIFWHPDGEMPLAGLVRWRDLG
ncbi:MAG: acyl-CoA reductase [Verrucomicrobiota bacterium]